jgi:centrin-3
LTDSSADSSQAMIDEFDMDGDGEISQEEFIAIMMDGE